LGRAGRLLALGALLLGGGGGLDAWAETRIEVSPGPAPRRSFYRTPIDVRPAPGNFRPRRHFAGLLTAMANPPTWSRPGRLGLGVWVEPPDRPVRRPDLPEVLHAGDRLHTGTRGLARLRLPGPTIAWLASETTCAWRGTAPSRGAGAGSGWGSSRAWSGSRPPGCAASKSRSPGASSTSSGGRCWWTSAPAGWRRRTRPPTRA